MPWSNWTSPGAPWLEIAGPAPRSGRAEGSGRPRRPEALGRAAAAAAVALAVERSNRAMSNFTGGPATKAEGEPPRIWAEA
jgi:hypothetical protein